MNPRRRTDEPAVQQLRILLVSGTTNVGLVSKAEFLADQGHDVSVLLEERHPGTESLGTGTWADLWEDGAIHVRPATKRNKALRAIAWTATVLSGLWTLFKLRRQHKESNDEFPRRLPTLALTVWTTRKIHTLARSQDIVHVRDGAPARRVAAALELWDYPATLVVSFLGLDLISLTPGDRERRYARVYTRAQQLTVATNFMKETLISGGAPQDRLTVVPSTIDFNQCPERRRNFAEDGITRLVSVGRLIEYKGFRYSILATKALVDSGRCVQLSILGSGPLRDDLELLVERLDLAGTVFFKDRTTQSETYMIMSESDILLHPALTLETEAEAMGLVSLEAQQIGLHVITTDSGGLPETVVAEASGLIVPQRDADSLAKAVIQIQDEDEQTRVARIRTGRDHVATHFTIQTQGPVLLDIYRASLGPSAKFSHRL